MKNNKKILVIGSAHVDIISKSLGDPQVIDKPGINRIEIGGTAANIALNLSKISDDSRLLTALNDHPFSSLIRNHLYESNVHLYEEFLYEESPGIFSAHLNNDGDLTSAISSNPIEFHSFSESILEKAASDVSMIIADCNLSSEELGNISIFCLTNKIKMAVAGVSEPKSMRALRVKGLIDFFTVNEKEAAYLIKNAFYDYPEEIFMNLAAQLSFYMQSNILLTLGPKGSIWYDYKQKSHIHIPVENIAESGTRLGAGDALLCTFSYLYNLGAPPSDCLKKATRVAQIVANKISSNLKSNKSFDAQLLKIKHYLHNDELEVSDHSIESDDVDNHNYQTHDKDVLSDRRESFTEKKQATGLLCIYDKDNDIVKISENNNLFYQAISDTLRLSDCINFDDFFYLIHFSNYGNSKYELESLSNRIIFKLKEKMPEFNFIFIASDQKNLSFNELINELYQKNIDFHQRNFFNISLVL